jgi:uncharacterized membrane protein YeaQ/YmgE (transglycosylase-associated protein family)
MNLDMLAVWVLVGLVAGWLAGFVMKGGGYGLTRDLILGLAGSIVGSWVFRALGVSPGAGLFSAVVVAFLGAAIVLVAQRKIWYAHA